MDDIDHAILVLEHEWFRFQGHKEQEIRDRLGIKPTEYYRRLVLLLDDPEAWAAAPQLMKRLQRRVDGRRAA